MKIVLISIINNYVYGNTGVDFIAHHLRKDERDIVETEYYHNKESNSTIMADLPLDADMYGFSVFETNYVQLRELANDVKMVNPKAVSFFGGQFVSMNYVNMLKECQNVDYFILGEGESPIKRLVDFHRNNDKKYLHDKNIVSLYDYIDKSLNVETNINRGLDFDYFKYDNPQNNARKTHCIMTKSNVCAGACTFCCSRKGRVYYKDIDRVVNEIAFLAKTYNVRKYFITDDDIFDIDNDDNRYRLGELFERIIDLNFNLTFSGFSKAKSICNPKNYGILLKMYQAGFTHLFIGIDAGNETDRILYNKRSSLDEGKKAVALLNQVGITPRYGMIFFNPYTTFETMRDNYRFLVELKSANYFHYGGLRVQLLNGTKLLDKTLKDNLLTEDYSFMNTVGYKFQNSEIQPFVSFMEQEFIPRADAIAYQFNVLKRKYAIVRCINYKAEKYGEMVKQYEIEEFLLLKNYFYHLYEEFDLAYCKFELSNFMKTMQRNESEYKKIIKELNVIYKNTPIFR